MTVSEIKAQLPEAEVYELKPESRYLLVVNRRTINQDTVAALLQHVRNAIIVRVDDPEGAIKLLEIKEQDMIIAKH